MTGADAQKPKAARGGLLLLAACLCTVVLALCGAGLYRPYLARLDGFFMDALISEGEVPPAGYAGPVVVAIDDEALARYGRWPWPRALTARLLANIAGQRPVSVGIDALFPEPERHEGGAMSPGDTELARVLCSGPFVLGYEFTFPPKPPLSLDPRALHPLNVLLLHDPLSGDPRHDLWRARSAITSLGAFSACVANSGFVNAAIDQDGMLRRMPVLIEHNGSLYPSLALATLLRGVPLGAPALRSVWDGGRLLQIDGREVPLDDHGRLLLRYRGWYGSTQPVSAAAVLDGRVRPGTFTGRVVFVGATATGMGETVATPLAAVICGVQVHAMTADNILRRDFARPAPWLYRMIFLACLAGVALVVSLRCSTAVGALIVGGVAVCSWEGAIFLFRSRGIVLSPMLPALVMTVNYSVLSLLRLIMAEKGAQRQKRDLEKARDLIMTSLTALTEIRDVETGAHIRRTQRYLHMLCEELAGHPRFREHLDRDTIELIAKLAPLHDIGKVGLPDHLLRKTSGFTREEYEEVKKHTVYGRDAIAKAAARVDASDDKLVHYAIDLTYAHHERWDGSGYPEKLKGDDIPWAGRIMALVDAYDAMVTQRVYNKPVSHDEAVRIISDARGRLFDPDVVDAFLKIEEKWRRVAREVAEEGLD